MNKKWTINEQRNEDIQRRHLVLVHVHPQASLTSCPNMCLGVQHSIPPRLPICSLGNQAGVFAFFKPEKKFNNDKLISINWNKTPNNIQFLSPLNGHLINEQKYNDNWIYTKIREEFLYNLWCLASAELIQGSIETRLFCTKETAHENW